MNKETKDALVTVLKGIYEAIKSELLKQLDLYSTMDTSLVEEYSVGITHIANLLSELDT